MSKPIPIKLVIVGDGAIGKTCILLSYSKNQFPKQYVPTIFDNSTTTIKIDKQVVNLGLWDTAGQQEFARLRPLAYANSDIFLIAFSVIQESSFKNVLNVWYPEIVGSVPDAVIIVVGNKIDLRDKTQKNPKYIYEKDARERLKNKNCLYHECSALTREGLNELFETAVREVLKRNARTNVTKQATTVNSTCQCQLI